MLIVLGYQARGRGVRNVWQSSVSDGAVLKSKGKSIGGAPVHYEPMKSATPPPQQMQLQEQVYAGDVNVQRRYAPSQASYAPQPQQPAYAPSQASYASQQPSYAPSQPSYAPQQPSYAPSQPSYTQSQPTAAPALYPAAQSQMQTPAPQTFTPYPHPAAAVHQQPRAYGQPQVLNGSNSVTTVLRPPVQAQSSPYAGTYPYRAQV